MRAVVVLVVVALAVVGGLLHPLSFALSLLPFNTVGLLLFLNAVKLIIADILGWAVVALLILMLVLVVKGRVAPSRSVGARRPAGSLSSTKMAVGIVAYNEAGAIGQLVSDFKSWADVVRVVVVDNNSTDGTAEIARQAGAHVVREPKQGYGFACIRALQECSEIEAADIVVLTEGDGTFAAEDLNKFRSYIGQADMVVGTRVVSSLVEDGSQMDYFFTWGNIAVSQLLRLRFWHSQFLGVASLSDVGCTYRAVRKDALKRILPDLKVGGHHFSPHMLLVALYRNLSLIEIPVTLRRRIGVSKGAGRSFWPGFKVGMTMIWHIITYSPAGQPIPTGSPQVAPIAKS